jgi:hypothetical protein
MAMSWKFDTDNIAPKIMRKFPQKVLKDFPAEFGVFKKLNSPGKIQDFLDGLKINFEKTGETSRSPLMVLRRREAHCIEGALLAAAALWYHGEPPLLLDLKTQKGDDDHVVALFKQGGYWGAISKTNHAVLRYRDPIYRTLRELVLSYFHEYFLDSGVKTLRTYSRPFSLLPFGDEWLTSGEDLWEINNALDESPHFAIVEKGAVAKLRLSHPTERAAGKIVEWKKK